MKQNTKGGDSQSGFMLVGVIVLVFLLLLALSVAAPRVAMELKREREVESVRRANQYVRAVQVYYGKFKHYPGSVEQLEKSNNQRFLRQKYLDPLTGKPDWRLIHVGENKTQVKGLFGQDLPGLPGGLGSAAGLASTPGGTGAGLAGGSPPAFGGNSNGPGAGPSGAGSIPGGGGAGTAPGATGSFGAPAPGGGFGTSGSSDSFGGATSTSGSGIASQNATDASGTGGPLMGVGSAKTGEAIVVVNEKASYQDWEFLYDPRIEQLKAKASLLGGISSGTGGTGGFGTPGSSQGGATGAFGSPLGAGAPTQSPTAPDPPKPVQQ